MMSGIFRGWRVRLTILLLVSLLVLIANSVFAIVTGRSWSVAGEIMALVLTLAAGALLFENIRSEIKRHQVLLRICEGLHSQSGLASLLDYIKQAAMQLVPSADKCVIHLLDESGRRLYPQRSSQPEHEQGGGMPADRGIAGQALRELRTLVVPDVYRDPMFFPSKSGAELRSLMVVPLHWQGQRLGTISLNGSVIAAFSERDEELITTLAAPASAAIHQAQLYEKARRAAQRVETAINNLVDGIAVLDAEDHVLFCNPSLGHILDIDITQILGRKVTANSEIEDVRRLASVLDDMDIDRQQGYERQVELHEPMYTLLHVNVLRVLGPDGDWERVVVLRDRTEELSRDKAKSNLVVAASRELRSPLDSIRGYVNLLMSYDASERASASWINQIREHSARLARLAKELEDLCSADCERMEIRTELVDLADLLAEIIAELEQATQRKQVTIDVQYPPNLPELPLDRDRIHDVLLNLFENALQRAVPGGHITLRVEANLEELSFTISDDGQPVPADVKARIFRGPYRPNGASPYDPSGTGLALYLSRKIVEAHGGHLWMPETEGPGAKVQFLIPIDRIPSAREPQRT